MFTNGISDPPVVRVDLDDWVNWAVQVEETNFGMPEDKRAVASSMMVDGERVTETARGNRQIKLHLKSLKSGDEAADLLQKVVRELDRPMNTLRWVAPDTTSPVFFRTFRGTPENVVWDKFDRRATITLLAEPYALGLMETPHAAVTVNNNPAHATNGCKLDFTGASAIKGDFETPLLLEYSGGESGGSMPGLVIGLRSGASPYPLVARQAEDLTQGSDTSVIADAAFSNGSKSRCTFTTVATMAQRLVGTIPASAIPAGAENRGRYRVLVRVAKQTSGDSIKMRITANAGLTYEPEVTLAATTAPQLIDLGVVTVHGAKPDAEGYGPTSYRAESLPFVVVQAQRVSGSGYIDMDYLLLVPADERVAFWKTVATTASGTAIVDGPNGQVYGAQISATPGVYEGVPTALGGGFPMLQPGDNRLVIGLLNPANAAAGNVLSTALTVTCKYWPRYLYARPVGT